MTTFFKNILLLLAAIAFLSHAAYAQEQAEVYQPEIYPIEAFGKLPVLSQPQLSPDGKNIAYLTSMIGGRRALIAHPISGFNKDRSIVVGHVKDADVARFTWANNDRILVTYSFYGLNAYYKSLRIEQTRLLSAGFDGKAFNMVNTPKKRHTGFTSYGSYSQHQSNIVDMLIDDPDHILLQLDDDMDGDPDIRYADVNTGRYSIAKKGHTDIYNWLTDHQGEPVLGWSTHQDTPDVHIDKSKRDIWSPDSIHALIDKGNWPTEISEDGETALFYSTNEHGRRGLARFSLASGTFIEWVHSHQTYDLHNLIRSDVTGRIVGVNFDETTRRTVYLGGIEKSIFSALSKAMPDASLRLISSDRSGNFFLVYVDTPQKTPKIFAYDRGNSVLSELTNLYENVDDKDVAPVDMHIVTMRDGLKIEVYVTTPVGRAHPNLPTIMMPHGGPASRDSAEFDYLAQLLANRGYLVLQPNFRGSSGYGEAFEALSNADWGGAMQDDLTDTMSWAVETGIADPSASCIVGWSYGGYAALMGAVKTPDQFNCAVSINGVADLPGMWTKDGNFVGGNKWRKSIGERRSELKDISPYHRAEEIKIPVLLIAAEDDGRVDYKQSKKMFKRLQRAKNPVEYVEIKLGGHSLDVDSGRIKAFTALVDFLEENIQSETGAR